MFVNKSKGSSLSIITQGIDFTGEVNTEGDIHLDGNMKGLIKANEVVIGPNGSFEGEIISNILIVSGNIKGKFNIKNLHIGEGTNLTDNDIIQLKNLEELSNGALTISAEELRDTNDILKQYKKKKSSGKQGRQQGKYKNRKKDHGGL